jgi:hypothetical protein
MNRFVICLFGAAAMFAGLTTDGWAAGETSSCKVTVKQVLLKTPSGNWVPIKGSEHETDLATEDPMLSLLNFDRVPPGKYVNFKLVVSETVKVTGRDGKNFTRAGGDIYMGGSAVNASGLPGDITALRVVSPTWNNELSGEMTERINLDYEDRDDIMEIYPKRNFLKPFIVKKGSAVHIWMTINLDQTMYFAFPNSIRKGVPRVNVMYFIPPSQIDDVSITVDSVSRYASTDEVAFDF